MKKAAVALLITVLIVISLAGCGGPSAKKSAGNRNLAASQPSSTTTTSTTGTGSTTTLPRQFEYNSSSLPADFREAADNSWVTVVAFYDAADTISNKVQDRVEEVTAAPAYNDQIRYLSYEVGTKTTNEIAKLTTVLGAKYTPNLTIIDGDRNIVFEKSGFTEKDYFKHALYNVVYKDKSPE